MKHYQNLFLVLLLSLSIVFISPGANLNAQESPPEKTESESEEPELDLTLDARDISLEVLLSMDVEVSVASLFVEDDLLVGSTVAKITPADWNRNGAKRTFEALDNQLGIVNYTKVWHKYTPYWRGLEGAFSVLLDGVPMLSYSYSSHEQVMPNWNLGALKSIEMIKGPGSSIYGSDAFHGVISMNTFESDKDHYSVQLGGGYPLYLDGDVKISQGLYDLLRFDLSASGSRQGDKEIEKTYDDPMGFPPPGSGFPLILAPDSGTYERSDKYTSQSYVFKTTIKPADKLKVKLGGYYNSFDAEGGDGGYFYPIPLYLRDTVADIETNLKMGKAAVSMRLPQDIVAEVEGYYWEAEYITDLVFGDYMTSVVGLMSSMDAVYTDLIPVAASGLTETNKNTRYGANLIIKQPDNALNLQWVLGYSYAYMEVSEGEFFLVEKDTGNEVPLRFFNNYEHGILPFEGESRKINSVFAQLKWEALKKSLYLLAGGRYDQYPGFGGQFTPRGGIIFLPTEKSAVKALYSRAFKAPTAGHLTAEPMDLGNEDIEPETIDIYELIYIQKSKNWKLEVNGYYSYWEEGIFPKADADTDRYIYKNLTKQKAYGGEIRGNYIIDPFAVDIGLAYNKSYTIDWEDPNDSSKKKDAEHDLYPTYTVIAGIYYTLKSQGIDLYLNNKLHKDWMGGGKDMPQFYRLDFNATKRIEDMLSISLNVNNILNKENANPESDPDGGVNEPGLFTVLRVNYKY